MWPFTISKADKQKNSALRMMSAHIKECHNVMQEAVTYLENPFLGKNPVYIAKNIKRVMNGYGR